MHCRQRHSSAGSHCARHQWHSSGGSTPYCAKLGINEPWLSRNGAHLTGSIVQRLCSYTVGVWLCTSQQCVLLRHKVQSKIVVTWEQFNRNKNAQRWRTMKIQWRFYTLLWEAGNQRTMTFQKRCTPYWFDRSMTLFLHSESLRCVLLNDVYLCVTKSDPK